MGSARRTVLVVEDEPILRMDAVDMILEAGFSVVEAADATEAVMILERRPDIRVVFTDVDMPRGIDGIKLAALVRDRWPPIEIIVTSGHVTPPFGSMPHRSVFFSKPYRHDEVIGALRRFTA